ncbi:succinate dehydrogenase, cytochrome b556 subunit [Thiohalorhabdus sp.]|uniref:succinate dehydrogenase, cytochrome b556 subunit n=1 Tax=Thiohalorhabdus sp. TaxID=3094134 RepID=UPI002FC27A89
MAKLPYTFDNRPVFLNLARIHFPVGAMASILHRLSGVLLILAVPGGLGLAEYSSRSAIHFRWVAGILDTATAAVIGAAVLAALAHHLLAGVRLMLMDVGMGVGLTTARRSAWGSLGTAGVLGVLALLALWPETGAAGGY